jgi:signal transduction histidine kinase
LIESALSIFQGKIVNCNVVVDRKRSTQTTIECFEDEIRQVLNNLVGNAIDAMSSGGHLSLRSREVTDWKVNRRGLQLTIADTGVGISPRHLLKGINILG